MTATDPGPALFVTAQNKSTVWIPLAFWLFIMTTLASFRARIGSELFESGGIDAQVVFQAVSWAALGAVAAYLVLSGRADLRLLRRGPMLWFGCFAAAAVLSAAWSEVPMLTAYRAFQFVVAIVLVISLREHLDSIYLFIVAYIAVNWIVVGLGLLGWTGGLEWIAHPFEEMSFFTGEDLSRWRFKSAFGHPSWISVIAAAGAVGLAARAGGRRWLAAGPIIAWLALTTLLTVSRSAIAGLIGGAALVAWGRRVLVPSMCVAGVVVPLLLISPSVREAVGDFLGRGQSSEAMESFTGRMPVYKEAWERFQRSWPLGEGYQAGRAKPLDETGENFGYPHAHNLFLESLASLGLPGIFFATMALIGMVRSAVVSLKRSAGEWRPGATLGWELAAMLLPLGAFCVMDSGFATHLTQVSLLFLVMGSLGQTRMPDETEQEAGSELRVQDSGFETGVSRQDRSGGPQILVPSPQPPTPNP